MASKLSVVGQTRCDQFCCGSGGICTSFATILVDDGQGNLLGFCNGCAGPDGLGEEVHRTFDALQAKQAKAAKFRKRDISHARGHPVLR